MSDLFADGLVIPALGLALLGWLVPRGLSLFFPEGVRPLIVLGLTSVVLMMLLSAAVFVGLYVVQGVPFTELMGGSAIGGLAHFAWLGLLSALLWGPIMLLSLAGLPKGWVKETW